MTPAPVGLRCPEHSGKPQGIQKVVRPAQRAVTGVGSAPRERGDDDADRDQRRASISPSSPAAERSTASNNWIFNHGALFASASTRRAASRRCRRTLSRRGSPRSGSRTASGGGCVTAAFLHYGPFHLAINMYSLYFAGIAARAGDRPLALPAALHRLGHRRLGGRDLV